MNELFEVAKTQLWDTAALATRDVEGLLGRLAGRAIDRGELYFQSVRSEAWVMEDGIVKEGAFSADRGVGVRAVKVNAAVLPIVTTSCCRPREATSAARSIVHHGGTGVHLRGRDATSCRGICGDDQLAR
jgi:TldD protein